MMMTMFDDGDDDEDKDWFYNIDYVYDDDDDDIYGNLLVCFTILHNPMYMGIWDMGINRVPINIITIIIVIIILTIITRSVYCSGIDFSLTLLALCFWINQLIIALIRCSAANILLLLIIMIGTIFLCIINIFYFRYALVKYPIKTHISFPTQKEKSRLFIQLMRFVHLVVMYPN